MKNIKNMNKNTIKLLENNTKTKREKKGNRNRKIIKCGTH